MLSFDGFLPNVKETKLRKKVHTKLRKKLPHNKRRVLNPFFFAFQFELYVKVFKKWFWSFMDLVTLLLLSCCHNIQSSFKKLKEEDFGWTHLTSQKRKRKRKHTRTHTHTHTEENGFRKSSASDINEVLWSSKEPAFSLCHTLCQLILGGTYIEGELTSSCCWVHLGW